jgi:transcriptional regulator with PAS, ATPase and Fis domain
MLKEKKPNFNLKSILDSHENPFVLIDENYTIIEANRAYYTCYDTSPNEIVGSKCHMIHHKSELPCHTYGEECPMKKVMETSERYEVSHVHHNLEYHPECVSIKGFPVTDEDGKLYLGEEIVQVAMESDAAEKGTIKSVEARYISQLLADNNGHRRKVADILKISERTLYRKLVNYNLTKVGKST